MSYRLLYYTRHPLEDDIYGKKLANSMHLALQEDQGPFVPLNHNSGVLFVKATHNADGTMNARSLAEPRMIRLEDGSVAVAAYRYNADSYFDTNAQHSDDGSVAEAASAGGNAIAPEERKDIPADSAEDQLTEIILFKSSDLIHYTEEGPMTRGEWKAFKQVYEEQNSGISITIPFGTSLPEGSILCGCMEISDKEAIRLKNRFITPVNVSNTVPETVEASCPEDLKSCKALASYSDGSSLLRPVDWETDDIDWSVPGSYELKGRIHQDRFEFPIAWGKADPCVGYWKGYFYFISTNDEDGNKSIYIRKSRTIAGLVTAAMVKILDNTQYPHIGNLLWAPEFHVIKNRLYIFHAATPGRFYDEQSHVMALKEGGDPMKASDWSMPLRVTKADGSPLIRGGITLDMTEFEVAGKYYVCWSQRQFEPVDQGAWLYFAQINPNEPWKLLNEPIILSKPEYGWANNHTFVDEGPFTLITKDKVYLTFSSAAVDSTYSVGLLEADIDADLMDLNSWRKENCPILTSASVPGEYGTGHNAYVIDEDGLIWNTYHARPGVNGLRSAGIRRVHFNAAGFPVLDMTREMDVVPALAEVKTTLIVK